MTKVFKSEDLKITIEPPTPVTDYLDIKLNPKKHVFDPYHKPNNHPVYLNVDSDHPKYIIKHIPKMIAQRLSSLSSMEDFFDTHKALEKSGYKKAGEKSDMFMS